MKATVLMGGGIDSSACAHFLQTRGDEVAGIFVDYGQIAADRERSSVEQLCARFGFPLAVCQAIPPAPFGTGELTGRNAFLLFCAVFLMRCNVGLLAIGVHAGTSYYDCSPGFIDQISRLVAEHTDGRLQVIAPFLLWNKGEIVRYFANTGIPAELTYSCEAGSLEPCGKCLSCLDRLALNI
jgi:7-cyano-7-deazaguanine synthase